MEEVKKTIEKTKKIIVGLRAGVISHEDNLKNSPYHENLQSFNEEIKQV